MYREYFTAVYSFVHNRSSVQGVSRCWLAGNVVVVYSRVGTNQREKIVDVTMGRGYY